RPESSRGRVNVKQPTPPPPATEPAPPAGPRTGDTGPFKTIAIKEKKTTYFHAVGILSFIVGAACMLAFGFFLYLPGIERGHNIALRYAQREVENTASLHQQEIDTLNADKNRLRDQITERDAEITHWQTQYNQNDRIIRVFMANSRYHMGNIEDLREAVNILMRVPLEGLPIDIVAMAEAIMESALPRLATHYATGGIASFNDGDYDRALIQLEDARLFITPHNPQFAHLLYHLGTLYYRIPARSEEAIEVLVELAALEGFATLPANPWNARRARVADMLENMGVALD
ncbi:MAG: hypothetical protein FWB88_10565, partial [Defluviitaleaceae bacterium]|nr:hypothetical protein [Defluviitaleaceae bacterium]